MQVSENKINNHSIFYSSEHWQDTLQLTLFNLTPVVCLLVNFALKAICRMIIKYKFPG